MVGDGGCLRDRVWRHLGPGCESRVGAGAEADTTAAMIVEALATWQLVEIVRHAKLTLAPRRCLRRVAKQGGPSFAPLRWLDQLVSCGFCLSVWAAAGVLSLRWAGPVGEFAILVLAVSRLANLGNDLAHDWCRTPRHDTESDDVEDGDDGRSEARDAVAGG